MRGRGALTPYPTPLAAFFCSQLAFSRRSDSGVRREVRKRGKIRRKRGIGALTPYPTPSLFFSAHISSRRPRVGTP